MEQDEEVMLPYHPSIVLQDAIIVLPSLSIVNWHQFDVDKYLSKGRLKDGEDRYLANKFNQAASDAVAFNRSILDSREARY